jgi:diguanylate cyclase (GGDEF)-like protein
MLHAVTGDSQLSLRWLFGELAQDAPDYLYLMLSTTTVFAVLGLVLGIREEQLEANALTDPLTGLWNRRHALSRLNEELARAKRYRYPLSVLLIDVDHLKEINDHGGHAAGDAALLSIAAALRTSCRQTDLAARHGGDEFMVIAPNTEGADGTRVAERIRVAVKRNTPNLSVSIGIAELRGSQTSGADELCSAADRALYEAKKAGRDRIVRASGSDATTSVG